MLKPARHQLQRIHAVGGNQKKEKMESIKKWFENFKKDNEDKKDLISQIKENITVNGFNEVKFTASIEKKVKSIEKEIIHQKFEPQNNENK